MHSLIVHDGYLARSCTHKQSGSVAFGCMRLL
jgi:hypothetical protein